MKISVVTIVFNDINGIERTLKSVIDQSTFKDIEYIVVDGKSTDGTSEVIDKYRYSIAYYICEKDHGIYDAMNKGLARATGDYIIFMNSGDSFSSSETIKQVIEYISANENLPKVAYGDYRESYGDKKSQPIPSRESKYIWYGSVCAHQSCFYNVKHLADNGITYDRSYKIAADYKFTVQAIKSANGNTLKMPLCVSDFDMTGISSSNQDLGLKEANRVRREVLGWGKTRIALITAMLLSARVAKKYLGSVYTMLRKKI